MKTIDQSQSFVIKKLIIGILLAFVKKFLVNVRV